MRSTPKPEALNPKILTRARVSQIFADLPVADTAKPKLCLGVPPLETGQGMTLLRMLASF